VNSPDTHCFTKLASASCASFTGAGGRAAVVSFGKRPFSSPVMPISLPRAGKQLDSLLTMMYCSFNQYEWHIRCAIPLGSFRSMSSGVSPGIGLSNGDVSLKSNIVRGDIPTYPSIKANRSYSMLQPPYLLMASTSGGPVRLKASRQMIEEYSTSMSRETRGLMSAGNPLPVWKYPHLE